MHYCAIALETALRLVEVPAGSEYFEKSEVIGP